MLRFVVLGLLRDGESRHGYALAKAYHERSGLRINTGNFYRELQRLASEGLVRAVTNPPDADVRRAPYVITAQGRSSFDDWLASARDAWLPGYEDALTSRALFLGDSGAEVLAKVFDGWGEAIWSLVKAIEREREAALLRDRRATPASFWPLSVLLARRLRHLAVELDFLDEYRTAYGEWVQARGPGAIAGGGSAPAGDAERSTRRGRSPADSMGSPAGALPIERMSRDRKPETRASTGKALR